MGCEEVYVNNMTTLKDALRRICAAEIPEIPAPITMTEGSELHFLLMHEANVPKHQTMYKSPRVGK